MSKDSEIKQAWRENFVTRFGVTPESAAAALSDGTIAKLLQHMYLSDMDMLRDCDLSIEGSGLQANAQLLWELMNIPEDVKKMSED